MVNTVMATETGAANSLLPTINNLIESSTTLSALKRSVAGLNAALGEELTPSLLRAGLNRCIKMAQNSAFAREIDALAKSKQIGRDSPLRKLSSFLDPDGLLRVEGRLQHTTMNEANHKNQASSFLTPSPQVDEAHHHQHRRIAISRLDRKDTL